MEKGALVQKGTSWYLVVSNGWDQEKNKYKQKWIKLNAQTERQAEKERDFIFTDRQRGDFIEPSKITLNDCIDRWIDDRKKSKKKKISRRTIEEYQKIIKNHIRNDIGNTTVQKLAPKQSSLLFQEIPSNLTYNDVLEVFERVNSGGTRLSKSDLLFSTVTLKIPDMEERFIRIVDDLNENGRHDFNIDFVIKTAFVVFGKGAKYDFKKLGDDDFLNNLQNDFNKFEKIITALRVWLEDKAFIKAGRFLRSKLALTPLIDYLIQMENYLDQMREMKVLQCANICICQCLHAYFPELQIVF